MSTDLVLHRGATQVARNELALVPAPEATETWFPLSHESVLTTVEEMLDKTGLQVERSSLSLSQERHRFFGVLDLRSEVVDGVSLSIGVRNSTDKSFPIGFCCGSRTFVCDNLAFSSEVVVSKRHTRYGEDRYREGIANAITSLRQFSEVEAERIGRLRERQLTSAQADSIMLQAYETEIVGTRTLPKLIGEWREPAHDEFTHRTAYSMLNCYTEVMKPRLEKQPHKAAYEIMRFQSLLLN